MSAQNPTQNLLPKIVIGVPGRWRTRSDFLKSIIENSEFLFAGDALYHPPSKQALKVELYDPDPQLAKAFAIAGASRIPAGDIENIIHHTMTAYLVGMGGSVQAARFMTDAATALLKAGGIAVKIESSGIAHSKSRWFEIDAVKIDASLFNAFVVYINGKSSMFSCGMHTFGLRDLVLQEPNTNPEIFELIRNFLLYSFLPSKPIEDGHTLGAPEGGARFLLRKQPCTTYPPDNLFHNPYGMWSVERITV